MSKKHLKIAFICGFAITASVPVAYSQTMTLLNSTTPNVNRVINIGASGTNGYVSGTAFTANFSGYTAKLGFTGASGVISGANPSWSVSGIGASAAATTISGATTKSNYIAAASGTVTLAFSKSISRFQFLWGSPGFSDTVTLFSAGKQVAQFTGAQVNAAKTAFTNAPGTTVIANLQTTGGITFDTVTMSNPTSTFEFSLQNSRATAPTVAKGGVIVASLPSPAPFPMLGATLLGNFAALLGMVSIWRKKYKHKTTLTYA